MSEENKNRKWINSLKYYFRADSTKVVLVILCILVLFVGITSLVKSGVEENITLVISFFGILATFVVISNYSQISETKSETNRKIIQHDIRISEKEELLKEQIEKQLKESEEKVKETNEDFAKIRRFVTTPDGESLISLLSVQFSDFKKQSDSFNQEQVNYQTRQSEIIQTLMYLIIGEHRELLLAVLQNQKYSCRVKHAGKSHSAEAYKEGDNIVFSIKDKIQTMDVSHVNGNIYNKDVMTKFLKTIHSLQETQKNN